MGTTYLVTIGISEHHGSELNVGWQWVCRLRAAGPLTVVTHRLFDDARFVNDEARSDFIFLGRMPRRENDFNRFHPYYAYQFWGDCRRYLRRKLTAEDRVFIVTPAALWFLPRLGPLRRYRDRVIYGPIGGELLQEALLSTEAERRRARRRNTVTRALLWFWARLSAQLPGQLVFRTHGTLAIFPGEFFKIAGLVPEVEAPANAPPIPPTRAARPEAATRFLVSLDVRLRKNTPGNLAVLAALTQEAQMPVTVLGTDALQKAYRDLTKLIATAEPRPPFPRREFLAFLAEAQPSVVSLSLSEGVPGYLLEALGAGCWVLAYPVGGISWLVDCAVQVIPAHNIAGLQIPGNALWFRWDDASRAAFQNKTSAGLREMMTRGLQ